MMTSRNTMRVRCAAVVGLMFCWIGLACSDPAKTSSTAWSPTAPLIAQVEPQLKMPAGTSLSGYMRYYYGVMKHGHRILVGVLIRDDKHAGIEITSEAKATKVLDGGCGVVNLKYDVDQKRTLAIFCNGNA